MQEDLDAPSSPDGTGPWVPGAVVVHPGVPAGGQPLVIAPYPLWMPRPVAILPLPPPKTAEAVKALLRSTRSWMVAFVLGTFLAAWILLLRIGPSGEGPSLLVVNWLFIDLVIAAMAGFAAFGLHAYWSWIRAVLLFRRGTDEIPGLHRENVTVASMHFMVSVAMAVLGVFIPGLVGGVPVDQDMLEVRRGLVVAAAVVLPFMAVVTRARCNVHVLRALLPPESHAVQREYLMLELVASGLGAAVVGVFPLEPIPLLAGNQVFLPSLGGAVALLAFLRLRLLGRIALEAALRQEIRGTVPGTASSSSVIEEHVDSSGTG